METILIVDDEEPVRRTFAEWLSASGLPVRVLVAAESEEALRLANQHPIDLAVLDWNLGAGNDGLQLLEDLSVFQPDIVAIMVTGYAHQATPLDALRMGVRDYLDKNQDLTREIFVAAVRRQLEKIAPAKQQRAWNESLAAFRASVEKILPLVQSAAVMTDPVPVPRAVSNLCRFLGECTGAGDGVLIVRSAPTEGSGEETLRIYDAAGERVEGSRVPFARSVAAAALSVGEPCVMNALDGPALQALELHPCEQNRTNLLAVPIMTGAGLHAVLELFDRPGGFGERERRLASAASALGGELLRHALAERQTQRGLFDAVEAALAATRQILPLDAETASPKPEQPLPDAVMEQLRQGLASTPGLDLPTEATLRLAEEVRVLAVRHGQPAIDHCLRLVASVRLLLDSLQEG